MQVARERLPEGDALLRCFLNRSHGGTEWVHPHWHDAVEILLVQDGEAIQQINGCSFRIADADIVFIPSEAIHSTTAASSYVCSIQVVQFDPALMSGYGFLPDVILPCRIKSGELGHGDLLHELRSMVREWDRKGIGYERRSYASLLSMYAHLETLTSESDDSGFRSAAVGPSARSMLQRTFRLIDNAYGSALPLERAARESNLSVTHFCRLFRTATGRSYKEYLTAYRVDKAATLLRSNKERETGIGRIALDCGFGSVHTMIRAFHAAYGCTPRQYREKGCQVPTFE